MKFTMMQKLSMGAKAGFQGGNTFNSMIMHDKNIMGGIGKFTKKEIAGELHKQTWKGDDFPKEKPIFDEDGNVLPPYPVEFGIDKMIMGNDVECIIDNGIEGLMKNR